MPVRHLLVWLVAGTACWCLIAVAALAAPEALLALAALLVLPWLRRPASHAEAATGSAAVEPVLLPAPAVQVAAGVQAHGAAPALVA